MRWAETWRGGYGAFVRSPETVERLAAATERLVRRGAWPDEESVYRMLAAADRLASAAMWVVAHMTYFRGRPYAPLRVRPTGGKETSTSVGFSWQGGG